ncbi:hypothetical protein D3C77_269230 [compost metagenome]
MLGDVLVQYTSIDIAQLYTQLASDIGLHGLDAVAGNRVEADQVTEKDVIAIAATDRIVARFSGFGMAKNGFGQLARIDVGLRFAVGVIWLQVVGIDAVVQTNCFDAREV